MLRQYYSRAHAAPFERLLRSSEPHEHDTEQLRVSHARKPSAQAMRSSPRQGRRLPLTSPCVRHLFQGALRTTLRLLNAAPDVFNWWDLAPIFDLLEHSDAQIRL